MFKKFLKADKSGSDATKSQMTVRNTGKPVDFSHRNYKKLSPVDVVEARRTRLGSLPEKSLSTNKYLTKAIWLNNNKLRTLDFFDEFVDSVLDVPSELAWIDLSFNKLTKVEEMILKYKNLKIAYFHGNEISELEELFKLRELTELKSVTFHGNPIAKDRNYRNGVIAFLPHITNLDFCPVLNSEKLMPTHPNTLKRLSVQLSERFEDEEEK